MASKQLKQYTLANGDILDLSPYSGKVTSIFSFVLVDSGNDGDEDKVPSVVTMRVASKEFVVCTLIPKVIPQVKAGIALTETKDLSVHVSGGSGLVKIILGDSRNSSLVKKKINKYNEATTNFF